ncbi:MAG: DUF2341 domain-containing protein, partial [Bacteroidales bacterium]|nr:DUF2341 domain-containing protein [Bacteroidales bacterium]
MGIALWKSVLLLLMQFVIFFSVVGQTTGDYRSKASGNWTTLATWERWTGGTWIEPNATQGWPAQNASPSRIDINHNVTLNVNLASAIDPRINDLYINAGTLQLSSYNFRVNGITSISGTLSDNSNTGTDVFYGQVTINGTGTWNSISVTSSPRLQFSGGIQNNNNFQAGFAYFLNNNQSISGDSPLNFYNNVMLGGNIILSNQNTSTVTINGLFDRFIAGDTPTWINGNGSTLVYNNAAAPFNLGGTLDASTPTNTVIYGRGGGQAIYSKPGSNTYHHLVTSGGTGTKTLQGSININGDLTIGAGTTLDVSSSDYSINIKGDWNNQGSFAQQSGAVTFNGSSNQSISRSSTETFYILTLTNSAGLTISNANVRVSNTLNMGDGDINTGSYRLILGTSTSNNGTLTHGSGTIIGEFERWLSNTSTPYLFPLGTADYHCPALITFNNLADGSLIGEFISGNPGDNGLAVMDDDFCVDEQFTEGYWSLTSANSLVSTNYDLELTADGFDDYIIDAETRLITRANSSSDWYVNGIHVAASGNTVKRSDLSILSAEYGLGDGDPSTVSATVTPDAASICAGSEQNFTGSASGGSGGPYSYLWTGSGSGYLSDDDIQSPDFNSPSAGTYDLTLVVTDNKGCTGSDDAIITVNPLPAITLGYSYSKILNVDPNQVPGSENLVNFPLLVSITDIDLRDHVESANGYDIIFSDENYNKLSYQLESYDPVNGQLIAWVMVPVLDCDDTTKIRMFYGNPQVTSDLSSTDLWGSYSGVWHLDDFSDETGNNINATNYNVTTIDGIISGGQYFNGSTTTRIKIPRNDLLEPTNGLTVSLWLRRTDVQNTWAKPLWYGRNELSPWGPYGFEFNNTEDNNIRFHVSDGSQPADPNTGTIININTWYYLTGTFDGSNVRIYVNQNLRNSVSFEGPIDHYDTCGLTIGNRWETDQGFEGILDEIRISRFVLSQEWIQTEYNNQQESSTFLIRGPEIINSVCPDTVCPNSQNINYSVPASGNTFNWEVIGSSGLTGNGTNSILVDFLGGPEGNIILTETNLNCSATDTFDVLINDFRDPIAICKDTVVYLDATGNITIDSSYVNYGSTDNCGILTITLDRYDFDCEDVGDNTVTLTVTDRKGRTDQCTTTVTVHDTISPIAVCQDIDIYLDATGNATIVAADVDGGSSDACGISTLAIDISAF